MAIPKRWQAQLPMLSEDCGSLSKHHLATSCWFPTTKISGEVSRKLQVPDGLQEDWQAENWLLLGGGGSEGLRKWPELQCKPSEAWDSSCQVGEGVWDSTNDRRAWCEHDEAWDGYCQMRDANMGRLRVIAAAGERVHKGLWVARDDGWVARDVWCEHQQGSERVCGWGRHTGTTCGKSRSCDCRMLPPLYVQTGYQVARSRSPDHEGAGMTITHSFTIHSVL